jgi:hypothetical protein
MNTTENVIFLAQANAKRARPLREEEVKKNIPYIEVYENPVTGKLDTRAFGHHGHDNEGRMGLYETYFKQGIFPNIDPAAVSDVRGFYNIELHDGYNYLDNGKDYSNVMTFSKTKGHANPILIPDPYQVCNWGGALASTVDNVQFENKLKKVVFCGTTTGSRDPVKNLRLQACKWSLDHCELCEFKITKVAQMTELDVLRGYGDAWKDMYLPRHVSQTEQMKYRYHMNIDGNVSRYDVWPFKTNSLVLKLRSYDMLWYHPLMRAGYEFVDVNDLDELKYITNTYDNNPLLAKTIISNANKTATELFHPFSHTVYSVNLFECMSANKA